jgi:repressor LexA
MASALVDQLTSRQASVFDFIKDRVQSRGYGPTVREIGEHFQISSPNGVMCHLRALEKKGLLTRVRKKDRAIARAGNHGRGEGHAAGRRRGGRLDHARF